MDQKNTINKASLVKMLVDRIGVNQKEGKEIIDVFFEQICSTLESGKSVKISGLGTFLLRDKLARPGRNPKTGEIVTVSPRRVVVFHSSNKLKREIMNNKENLLKKIGKR